MRIVREEPPPPEEEYPTNGHGQSTREGAREPPGQTWEDFRLSAAADTAMEWVEKPFIPPTGLVVIAGEQKSGKTLWTAWLVGHILRRSGRVLFVELEGSRKMLEDRIQLFSGEPIDMLGLTIRFRLKDTVDERGIARLVTAAEQVAPNLIVIDPLVRAMTGDENDTREMRKVVENLEALSLLANCPVALLHHVRKAPKEGRGLLTSADVRGSSVILSAASVIAMVQKRHSDEKSEARFDVTCEDSWYEKFPVQRCCVDFKARSADEALTFIEEEDEEMDKPKTGRPALMNDSVMDAKIMAYLDLQASPVGKRDIRTAVPGRDQRKDEALFRLIESGKVTVTGGKYMVRGQLRPNVAEPYLDTVANLRGQSPPTGVVIGPRDGIGRRSNEENGHTLEEDDALPVKRSITCLAMVDGRVCGWPTVQGLPYCAKHPHGQVESRP